MHDDDRPIGRLLSRREALQLLGAVGLLPVVGGTGNAGAGSAGAGPRGAALPACIVRPAQTVGPYFVDERLNRSDVRSDPADGSLRPGAPLELTLELSRIVNGVCTPFEGAVVDIWQCDAAGMYSDVTDRSFDTRGQKWLRGYQVSDAAGRVRFTTIYPGWYQGRTVHVHFKVRTSLAANAGEFVSQLYFDDGYTDGVFAQAPYVGRPGRRTRNAGDGIFRGGGSQLLLDVRASGGVHRATFALGVQL